MATVYKRGGNKQRGGRYYISYFDHEGERVSRSARTSDKATAERIAAKLEAQAALRREGVIDPREDRLAQQDRRPVSEHLAEFQATLLAKGNDENYVRQSTQRAQVMLTACQITRVSQVSASAVQLALGSMRSSGKSLGTCNGYLRSIKAFAAWLTRDRRLREDPLKHLTLYNEITDRRHIRREPSPEEIVWLLNTTRARNVGCHGLKGPEREMLYLLAMSTGLRASEIRSLTKESFYLDQSPPVVKLAAAYSKRRRDDCQPLPLAVAEKLRPWLAERAAGQRVFSGMPTQLARMLRGDLAAARKAWIESVNDDPEEKERRSQSNFLRYQSSHDEIWDFHAFRHGFISAVVQSGASVKVAQELARHASPMLTIGRYAHARLQDLRGAVEALPIASAILADTSIGEAQHKAQQLRSDSVPNHATACSSLPGR